MVSTVKIGDIDYSVIVDEEIVYDSGRVGQADYRNAEIKISSKQNEQVMQNTLVHEAVHAMLEFMGERGTNNEETVIRIANGLCMLIKDNPKLFNLSR